MSDDELIARAICADLGFPDREQLIVAPVVRREGPHMSARNQSVRLDRRLREITKSQQRYDARVAADALAAVKQGVCPFCGSGPFTVVALHVAGVHGIKRRELRDYIGVSWQESICDPTYAQALSEHMRSQRPGALLAVRGQGGTHGEVSAATRRERARIADARRDTKRLLIEHPGMTFAEIADTVGLHVNTVGEIAADLGLRRNPNLDRRQQTSAQRAALAGNGRRRAAEMSARRRDMAAAYIAGATVDEIARQYGITRKMTRQHLASEGLNPPPAPTSPPPATVTFDCAVCKATVTKSKRKMADQRAPWVCSRNCAARRREAERRLSGGKD